MKCISFDLNGRPRCLLYNAAAFFELQGVLEEALGDSSMSDALTAKGADGLRNLALVVPELARQGELYRRSQGFPPLPLLTADELTAGLSVMDIVPLQLACMSAVSLGLGQRAAESNEDDVVDLGLLALREHDGQLTRAVYQRAALRLGIGLSDAMQMTPGELFDILDIVKGENPEPETD